MMDYFIAKDKIPINFTDANAIIHLEGGELEREVFQPRYLEADLDRFKRPSTIESNGNRS